MQVADTISYFYKANNNDVKMIISQTNVRYFIYIGVNMIDLILTLWILGIIAH